MEYAVTWRDIRDGSTWDVYEARIDTAGLVHDEVRLTDGASGPSGPSAARSGSELAIAFADYLGNEEVYFARFDAAGVGSPVPVTDAPGTSEAVVITALAPNAGYALAWFDSRSGTPELYFRVVDSVGTPLGAETEVDGAPFFQGPSPYAAGMAWNGRAVMLAWADTSGGDPEIYLAEICPE